MGGAPLGSLKESRGALVFYARHWSSAIEVQVDTSRHQAHFYSSHNFHLRLHSNPTVDALQNVMLHAGRLSCAILPPLPLLRSGAGQVQATCRHDACHLNFFFFYRNVQGRTPNSRSACLFSKLRRRHVGRKVLYHTTGQHFLGNKRLDTFQITDSRLRDQTTVGSNYFAWGRRARPQLESRRVSVTRGPFISAVDIFRPVCGEAVPQIGTSLRRCNRRMMQS